MEPKPEHNQDQNKDHGKILSLLIFIAGFLFFLQFCTGCGPLEEEVYEPDLTFFSFTVSNLQRYSGTFMYSMRPSVDLVVVGHPIKDIEKLTIVAECFNGIYRSYNDYGEIPIFFKEELLPANQEIHRKWTMYNIQSGLDRIRVRVYKVKFFEEEERVCYPSSGLCHEQIICLDNVENCEVYELGLTNTA